MPIFTVATKFEGNDEPLKSRITARFPSSHYEIGRGHWLIAFAGTSKELFGKLFPEPDFPLTLKDIVIFSIEGYWGIKPEDMWEWIKVKRGAEGG